MEDIVSSSDELDLKDLWFLKLEPEYLMEDRGISEEVDGEESEKWGNS